MINKQDMLDVGAVADLRAYLVGQESVRDFFFASAFVVFDSHV